MEERYPIFTQNSIVLETRFLFRFMDKTKQEKLKENLKKEEKLLIGELESLANTPRVDTNYETRFPSFGSHTAEQDENAEEVEKYIGSLSIEHRLEGQLKDIREALEKMEKGLYGICERCKKEIAMERLEASSAAKTCLKCR